MEVAILHSSHHHPHMDPSFVGQSSNLFLTGLGGQHSPDRDSTLQSSIGTDTRCVLSPSHTDYSEEIMDSPDLSSVTWEDFAATSWEAHARMLEQNGGLHQAQHPALQVQLGQLRYGANEPRSGFSRHSPLPGASPMNYSLSPSASPAPELIRSESFTSPLTPVSFDPESRSQSIPARNQQHASQRGDIGSTHSPSRSQGSPGSRRKTQTTSDKKVVKPTSAPNARSAHSAIERKYRENINNKIAELHKVLCTAGPPLYAEQEIESGGYPYSRLPRTEEDDCSGMESGSASNQPVLPAKKADVLAGAISYVRRSEKEKKLLVDQLRTVTAQLHHFEALVRGRNPNIG